MTEKRYKRSENEYDFVLEIENEIEVSETWYNLFENLLFSSLLRGKKIEIKKENNRIVKGIMTDSKGVYKTERTFTFKFE